MKIFHFVNLKGANFIYINLYRLKKKFNNLLFGQSLLVQFISMEAVKLYDKNKVCKQKYRKAHIRKYTKSFGEFVHLKVI